MQRYFWTIVSYANPDSNPNHNPYLNPIPDHNPNPYTNPNLGFLTPGPLVQNLANFSAGLRKSRNWP